MNDRSQARPALRRLSPVLRLFNRVALVLLREDVGGQGRHFDPEAPGAEPPPVARWTRAQRDANASTTMNHFRAGLRHDGTGTERDGVLDDLAEYHGTDRATVLRRCLEWEVASVAEWEAAPRDTEAGLADFYNSVESWSYDLLWYAYLQSVGYGYPESVIAADRVGTPTGRARLLDLGSGVGVTAQMFASLGYEVTLADISKPLLEFARWRLERHGVAAEYLLLPHDLPRAGYDLITALDVMVHVPDIDDTAADLHDALRTGGLLVANYDVRRASRHNAWHLYEDDLPLRWAIERAGFVPVDLIDGILWIYRAVPTTGLRWRIRTALTWLRLASPPARAVRAARRVTARAALVVGYRVLGALSKG